MNLDPNQETNDITEDNFNEAETTVVNENTEGDFTEADTAAGDNITEGSFKETKAAADVNDVTEGDFTEVSISKDNSEGDFRETDGSNPPVAPTAPSVPTGTGPSSYPAQNSKSPKVLVGVVIALAVVILGLIIFLVISIINKNKDNGNTDPAANTPTTNTITITPDTDIYEATPTPADNSATDGPAEPSSVPEFNVTAEIGEYKGITVDYELPEVTEEDVEGSVEYFRSTLSERKDVEGRALKDGDTAIIDFVGTMDGEVFDGGSATGYELVLGSGQFIDGFESGIIGKNIGDSISLDLNFPDPYVTNPDYSGKPVNFMVNITGAYEYVSPELTDELVAANSSCSTVAEYREEARKQLELQAVEYADSQAKSAIIKKLIESAKFSGPVEEQIAYEEQSTLDYYDSVYTQQYGIDGATYFGYMLGITTEEYYSMVHEQSEMAVKYNHVLEAIAEKEGFTVSDEEYTAMFEETFYQNYGLTSEEEVYEHIPEDEVKEIINNYVLLDKAEKLVMETAIINK